MAAVEILGEFIRGRHTVGQMVNLARYVLGKKGRIAHWQPVDISIFLTFRCNLSCDMCLTHSRKFSDPWGQKSTRDVDFNLFKEVLARYSNALNVNIIGNGEPLLHPDFFRMVEYASRKMKMNVNSSSNGIIVGNYAEQLADSSLKHFNISVNGHSPEEFQRMTGMPPDLFEVIRDNTSALVRAKKARRSRLKIAATFILDRHNAPFIEDIVRFADGLGVDEIAFFQFLPSPAPGFTPEERCLFSDNTQAKSMLARLDSLPPAVRKKVMPPVLLDRAAGRNRYCTVWQYNISIDGDRNAGGCSCQLLDLSQSGRFDEDPWNNIYFQDMRARFMDPYSRLPEPCAWCYNNSGQIRERTNPFSRLLPGLSRLLHR